MLFLVRCQQPRTPQWFFRLFHNNDMGDFRYKIAVHEERRPNRPGCVEWVLGGLALPRRSAGW